MRREQTFMWVCAAAAAKAAAVFDAGRMRMKLAVISFTKAGSRQCMRLVRELRKQGEDCGGYMQASYLDEEAEQAGCYCLEEPVTEWSKRQFKCMDGLVYIGAVGIAIRAIAPWLEDKMTDPAVVAVDDAGNFAISLLSGHVGGANTLTKRVAQILGATPVITTATDIHGKPSVDAWAAARGLALSSREMAKQVAMDFLEDRRVGFSSDYPLEGPEPGGYCPEGPCGSFVWITAKQNPQPGDEIATRLESGAHVLRLIPKVLTVGIGCRKNAPKSQIEEAVRQVFDEAGLDLRAAAGIASIDLKREEPGLRLLAEGLHLPFATFSSEELERVSGSEAESSFVRQVTGTGNVCERAALLGAGEGSCLLVRKQIQNGVTVAVAEADLRIGIREGTF